MFVPILRSVRRSSSDFRERRKRISQFLLEWLQEAKINRAGCFKYEAVEGAKANALDGAVPEEVKEERWHRFMAAQKEVSGELLRSKSAR